jgi:endonuclease/exonuclease/phosphatase family metal-dependent hydrolase
METPTAGRFRLLTANLLNGGADPAAFARLVRTLGADVVAVQELTAAQADALAAVLPFGRLEPAPDHTGMGIALRWPGTVSRIVLPRRAAYAAECTVDGAGGEALEILNVHVLAPHMQPAWRTLADRRRQIGALEAYLEAAPRRHRAVVGDLNSTPAWPLYRRLARRFRDAAVEAARQNGHRPGRTWGPWPGAPRLFRIDHVLVTGLAVHEARVVAVPGSDHSAVVVDLAPATGAPDRGR